MIDAAKVRAVFIQDLLDVRRARLVQGVVALYVLFVGLAFYAVTLGSEPSTVTAVEVTSFVGYTFVPLVALVAAYLSIAGERESGTIRFLLGYPVTRAEVLVGKLLARLGLVFGAIALSFGIGTLIALLRYSEQLFAGLWIFAGLTMLFAGSYVGMATGISAVTDSRSRAMTGTIAGYFVFTLFWMPNSALTVPAIIGAAAQRFLGIHLSGPLWEFFAVSSPPMAFYFSLQVLPFEVLSMEHAPASGPVMVVVLLAWILVPPALGYLVFRRTDVD